MKELGITDPRRERCLRLAEANGRLEKAVQDIRTTIATKAKERERAQRSREAARGCYISATKCVEKPCTTVHVIPASEGYIRVPRNAGKERDQGDR